jgi:hypothetical protein
MPMKVNLREYRSWYTMNARCFDPEDESYKNYGGRGITVCKRWRKFSDFVKDMGPRPEGYSIDRINNNGNYTPSNCRWATMVQQQRNKRNNLWLTFRGRTLTQAEWAEVTGLDPVTIDHRRKRGWSLEDVLTTPANARASQARYWAGVAAKRTHCKRGHELTPENIYPNSGPNSKDCKKCALVRAYAFRARQRAKAAA